jgi:hypothetical protein
MDGEAQAVSVAVAAFCRRAGGTGWLDCVAEIATSDYALAVEVARMRGLVKGYGDTVERGRAKFEQLAAALPRLRNRDNAPARLADLIKAASADEHGGALQKAPRHPGLLNSITRLDLEAGRNKEALARLDAVIETGQAPPAALLARARIAGLSTPRPLVLAKPGPPCT